MGDIAHIWATSPTFRGRITHPDWTHLFEDDPAQAIKSRKGILDRVAPIGVMAAGATFRSQRSDLSLTRKAHRCDAGKRSVLTGRQPLERRNASRAKTLQNCCP
jgi:hypothetical protein